MKSVEKGLMLASSDSVAIDAVAAKIMGFDPMKIDYIRMAHEDGLRVGRIEEIEVLGEDISAMNFGFTVGENFASRFGDLLWFSPFRKTQKIFFHTPLVYIFILGSYFYHDWIWWPFAGKPLMTKNRANTQWGIVFDKYAME